MTVLKLLLSSIIYVAAMAIANPIDEKWQSDYILPLHYEMQLTFNLEHFIGNCTIIIYIIFATQHISFHAPSSMTISKPKLKRISSKEELIYELKSILNKDNFIVLYFDDTLLPGIYTLYMEFSLQINEDFFETIYTREDGGEEWLIATGLQPKKPQIFPSWDKPELKVTFNISIMHHQRQTALSNMPTRVIKSVSDDMMWTHFYQTSLMSIDSVAFVVSNLQPIFYETVNKVRCRPQLESSMVFAQSVVENVTMYLEKYWNNSKRILEWTLHSAERKVDHIAIPNSHHDVKQTFGFVFYKESDIAYNEKLDTVERKMKIARLIAREMAQKYIGNLLSPTCWFHLWLNEGFTTFLQAYIIEKAIPKFRMMDLFVVQVQHDLLNINSYLVRNPVIEYNSNPENHLFFSYVKGSIIWRMLERSLPRDVFLKGIDRYLNNQFSNPEATTSDHLWNAMQSVINTLDHIYRFDVKRMMDSWAMQKCFPVLEVMRNYSHNVVTVSVQFHELDEKQYYIPFKYMTAESNLIFVVYRTDIWLTPSYPKIEFPIDEKNQWIVFNLQQAGYYRVNYDSDNWQRIARFLNFEEYKNFYVLNRAQIINDAFYFAVEKKLDFSVFWNLAKYLSKETDYIAWYPMFKVFEFISNIFAFLEEVKVVLSSLKFITRHPYTELNILMSDDDHTKCLKQELAKWNCIIDSVSCRAMANDHLQQHLTNPEQIKFLPGWKKWTYCNGLKIADLDTWNKVFDKLYNKNNFDHTILECLTYSEKPEIIIHYLENTLPKVTPMYMHKLLNLGFVQFEQVEERTDALTANIFLSILAKNTKHMLKDMLKNFRKLKHKRVSDIAALTVIINNVYMKEQFDEIHKFVKDEFVETVSIFAVERKIEIRSLEIDRQIKYFQFLFSPLN